MAKRFAVLVATALAGALLAAAPASAELITKKLDWTPVNGVQKVADLQVNDVAIPQIVFDNGDTIAPIRRSSAKAMVRVDNNSQIDQEVGVAVAVFDADGNMIAAGNGGNKVGELGKGEREDFAVSFAYVYRNLKSAKYILVTLETKPKGSGKWKPTPKPTPAP
jgi:hypothetical protein